jgi:RNA polymerase sigma factor (sigma-70 family)
MNAPDTSDEALLAQIAQQDRRAMHSFYVRHSQAVHSFAWRRLGDSDTAQDVVVDTMYEVWRGAGRFAGASQVKTWVLGIARHKLLDRQRADGRVVVAELSEDMLDSLADVAPGPYAMLAAKQRAQHLANCMEALPDVQKESLHLSFVEDMSLKEIALVQGVPMNTVATRVHHGKRKLADCLARSLGAQWRDGDHGQQ